MGAWPERLNRTSDTTAPPFWARPVWSSDRACQPAMSPAVARIWDTVTTPVPPTPVSRIPNESAWHDRARGRELVRADRLTSAPASAVLRPAAGTTVMNAGQSPSRQL